MNDNSSPVSPALVNVRQKIKTLDELAVISASEQQAGRKVVLAHGVFDLVHMGHVRHLEAARREGDLLIVTITADRFVNKGPGRPIFNEMMRAEMLAAMAYVDWVGVNHAPSAEVVLDAVKPDIYIKGSDYENPEDDITGKIDAERNVVERHGGRVVFTKDITFSSSALINRYLDVYDRPLRDYLDAHRNGDTVGRISNMIKKVADFRVLVVGDAIIDEYQYVTAMGKAAKEHIIATRFIERETFAGGVFAAANHVADFCSQVDIVTCLGEQESYEDFIRDHLRANVTLTGLRRPNAPTTRKTRFVDHGYLRKLFEVYSMKDAPLEPDLVRRLNEIIDARISDYDVVIVADFGHGMINASTIDLLGRKSRFLAVNTQTNSANIGFNLITKYTRADYICIDAPEAQLATIDRFSEIETLVEEKLSKKIDCGRIIVTHGKMGCVVFDAARGARRIPAFTKTVVDTIGAGDAFLAVTSPLAAVVDDMELVGIVGNAAGAMKVGIVGHRKSVERVELTKFIVALLK